MIALPQVLLKPKSLPQGTQEATGCSLEGQSGTLGCSLQQRLSSRSCTGTLPVLHRPAHTQLPPPPVGTLSPSRYLRLSTMSFLSLVLSTRLGFP